MTERQSAFKFPLPARRGGIKGWVERWARLDASSDAVLAIVHESLDARTHPQPLPFREGS